MNVNIISKYRSQLMGIAIVLVALFHSNIVRANNVLDYLCFSGDIGVDMFFFLSGFGMFYAYLKKPTVQGFYWKRLVRIVPVWFLVNLYILCHYAVIIRENTVNSHKSKPFSFVSHRFASYSIRFGVE